MFGDTTYNNTNLIWNLQAITQIDIMQYKKQTQIDSMQQSNKILHDKSNNVVKSTI